MNPPRFLSNERPTLGVEVELLLVDARIMALRGAIAEVLDALPAELHASVKPELLQCCLEVTTEVCRDVAEAERDLAHKDWPAEEAALGAGARLFWAGTHPFPPGSTRSLPSPRPARRHLSSGRRDRPAVGVQARPVQVGIQLLLQARPEVVLDAGGRLVQVVRGKLEVLAEIHLPEAV